MNVTATANTGYHFVYWSVTGGVVIANASSSGRFTVTAAGTVTANFALTTYTLTVSSDGNGTVTPAAAVALAPGDAQAVTAIPNTGYHFAQWRLVSGLDVAIADRYASATTVTLNSGHAEVRAEFVKGGSLAVAGIGSGADVFIYGQNGWMGRKVLDGPGTISNLAPGNLVLAVVESGRRTEYIDTTVVGDATVTVTVSLRNAAPVVSDTPVPLGTAGGPIEVGSRVSPVMADFDRNGIPELLAGRNDGGFLYFTKSGDSWTAVEGPKTVPGADLSVNGGMSCLRTADWDGDNRVDIIASDKSNHIILFRNASGTGGLVFNNGTVLFTAPTGTLTGFDLADLDRDAKPDLVIGYADGTVAVAMASVSFTWENASWGSPTAVTVAGAPLDAGADAMPCMAEVTGDTGYDLLVANEAGAISLYKNRNDGTFQDRGAMNAAGKPFAGSAIGAAYGGTGEFVSFIVSDAGGKISIGNGLLRGDFHEDGDNEVNVMDLQVFGDAWGTTEAGGGWVWKCNLDQTPDGNGKQVIDVFDLAIFGDSWLAKK